MKTPLLPRKSATSRAFTLMECLISIAIIAVLVALIMPAASRAIKSARQTSDLGNLRQISSAAMRLTQEHRNQLLVGVDQRNAFGQGVSTPWYTLLRPYLGFEKSGTEEVSVYVSPGDPSHGDALTTYALPARGFKRRSYGVNGRTFNLSNYPIKRMAIREPSRFLLMGNLELKGTDASGINSNSATSLGLMPRNWYSNGTANFLFVDGHVEAILIDDLMPGGRQFHLIDRSQPVPQ